MVIDVFGVEAEVWLRAYMMVLIWLSHRIHIGFWDQKIAGNIICNLNVFVFRWPRWLLGHFLAERQYLNVFKHDLRIFFNRIVVFRLQLKSSYCCSGFILRANRLRRTYRVSSPEFYLALSCWSGSRLFHKGWDTLLPKRRMVSHFCVIRGENFTVWLDNIS